MAIAVNDILRVALQWMVDGVDAMVNVHTFRVLDLGGSADDNAFAFNLSQTLEDELYSLVAGSMIDNVVGDVMQIFNLTKGEAVAPVTWGLDGASAGSPSLPRQTTALVYLNGSAPRRQGRVYLPVSAQNLVGDDGNWVVGQIAALASFGLALLDPIVDTTVSVQRVIADHNGLNAIVPTVAGVSLAPRTQRSRTPGRGA